MNTGIDVRVRPRPGVLALVVFAALCMATAARAGGEGDFDYWTKASFLIPIKEHWQFKFDQKFSFTDEGRRFDNHQQDYGVIYSGLADWLDLGFTVKQKASKEGDDWDRETRPLLNVTVKSTLFGCDLANRSRIEYRDFEDEDNVWRFRHKVRIGSPVTFTSLRIKPYAAYEIFYNFNAERFNGSRIQGGLFIPLHEKVRLELFYFWHTSEEYDHDWSATNVIGTYVRFKF